MAKGTQRACVPTVRIHEHDAASPTEQAEITGGQAVIHMDAEENHYID